MARNLPGLHLDSREILCADHQMSLSQCCRLVEASVSIDNYGIVGVKKNPMRKCAGS